LSLVAETKFQGYNSDTIVAPYGLQSANPLGKPGGTQPISYVCFNTGGPLQAAQGTNQWNDMDLFKYTVGDSSTQRDGNYLFIKGSTCKFQIQVLGAANTGTAGAGQNQGLNSPIEFRIMIVKANRKNNTLGQVPVLNQTLFLDTQNSEFGPGGTSASPYLYFNAPINTRRWLTYKDMKCTLQPAATDFNDQSINSSLNTSAQRYPAKKEFSIRLPVNKKVHYADDNRPDSIDTQWLVVIQAVNSGYTLSNSTDWATIGSPRNYRVQALATTSALDV